MLCRIFIVLFLSHPRNTQSVNEKQRTRRMMARADYVDDYKLYVFTMMTNAFSECGLLLL